MKENFEKETYICVVNKQDSQFPESHWVMVYQNKKKTYFIDSLGRDFTHHDFKFRRLVHQVSRRLQCLDSKLCAAYIAYFGCRLARGLHLNSIMHYLDEIADSTSSSTITSRKNSKQCKQYEKIQFNDEFIYNHINEKLQIVNYK